MSNFIKIRLMGAGLLHEKNRKDKWTGRHNETNSRFSQVCERAWKLSLSITSLLRNFGTSCLITRKAVRVAHCTLRLRGGWHWPVCEHQQKIRSPAANQAPDVQLAARHRTDWKHPGSQFSCRATENITKTRRAFCQERRRAQSV